MKFLKVFLLSVGIATLLLGCGTSGGGDDGTTQTGTISGSVSGTTVLAVNDNGDVVASDDTDGKIPVNGNYPFSLNGIPVGENIRMYLITQSGVYPMYFDINGDRTPDTNVFSLSSSTNVNLGFVSVNVMEEMGLTGQDGRAVPFNDPTDNPSVSPGNENTSIPTVINNPDTSGETLISSINKGLDAIEEGLPLKARTFFGKAVSLLDGSESQNDADTARFFYALTRIISLAFETYSDGNSGDMNQLGDILDRIGCPDADDKRANYDAIGQYCPATIPDDSPRGSDIQNFLYNVVKAELDGAISNLEAVSPNFNKQWTEPFDVSFVESDYGDVLVIRAWLKSAAAWISAQEAYNMDGDIDNAVNTQQTIEQFLSANPQFLDLIDFDNMTEAQGYLTSSALDDLENGIAAIQNETDAQNDDLINLIDITTEEINDVLASINITRDCITNHPCTDDNDTSDTSDDTIIDLSYLEQINDLELLLPTYDSENNPSGFLPDPTFGGMLIQYKGQDPGVLNTDVNPGNGRADIFD